MSSATDTETSDSIDSDLLSISGSSEELEPIKEGDPGYLAFMTIFRKVMIAFAAWKRCQQPGTENPPPTGKTIPGPSRERSEPTLRKRPLSSLDDTANSPTPQVTCEGNNEKSHRKRLFACPFWKKDPQRHRDCYRYTLNRIGDVKQHMLRRHTHLYCQRCSRTFPDDESLTSHLDNDSCQRYPNRQPEGITQSQQNELKRKRKNRSDEEQWFVMWDIVFPGRQRPSSPYLDADLSRDHCEFVEFLTDYGPRILADALSSECILFESHEFLRRILQAGMNEIHEQWINNRDAGPTPLEPPVSQGRGHGRGRTMRENEFSGANHASAVADVSFEVPHQKWPRHSEARKSEASLAWTAVAAVSGTRNGRDKAEGCWSGHWPDHLYGHRYQNHGFARRSLLRQSDD